MTAARRGLHDRFDQSPASKPWVSHRHCTLAAGRTVEFIGVTAIEEAIARATEAAGRHVAHLRYAVERLSLGGAFGDDAVARTAVAVVQRGIRLISDKKIVCRRRGRRASLDQRVATNTDAVGRDPGRNARRRPDRPEPPRQRYREPGVHDDHGTDPEEQLDVVDRTFGRISP